MPGARLGLLEERGALVRIVAELIAEDAESVGGVAEASGDLRAGQFFDEEGPQRFVLAMQRGFGAKEELGLVRIS
jgi:hypothetical protein